MVETINLEYINSLSDSKLKEELVRCSGSSLWAEDIIQQRPFPSTEAMKAAAEASWSKLGRKDWLEAFKIHPKIGDVEGLRRKFAGLPAESDKSQWASHEQSGVNTACQETLSRLALGNNSYEKKFGYIFIVCATGKSAAEMLELLEARLANDPEVELGIACSEQKKITQLRLEKLQP